MTDKTGGPAFPVAFTTTPLQGMTLRDYFAAKAMQAMISGGMASGETLDDNSVEMIKKASWHIADAMLAERNKSAQP